MSRGQNEFTFSQPISARLNAFMQRAAAFNARGICAKNLHKRQCWQFMNAYHEMNSRDFCITSKNNKLRRSRTALQLILRICCLPSCRGNRCWRMPWKAHRKDYSTVRRDSKAMMHEELFLTSFKVVASFVIFTFTHANGTLLERCAN